MHINLITQLPLCTLLPRCISAIYSVVIISLYLIRIDLTVSVIDHGLCHVSAAYSNLLLENQ